MKLEQFKELLNKQKLSRVEKSIYVYMMRSDPFKKHNNEIAKMLGETKTNASNLYRYASTRIESSDYIFKLVFNYIEELIKNHSEYRILKLKEAKDLVEQIKQRKQSKHSKTN